MASRHIEMSISVTETLQYQRLIQFVRDVKLHAEVYQDQNLNDICDELFSDLMGMHT